MAIFGGVETGPATGLLMYSGCPATMSDTLSAQIKDHFAGMPTLRWVRGAHEAMPTR
jgi:hypothetical protein